MLAREDIRDLYRRRIGRYDLSANSYYVFGFRERAYRRRAIRALGAQPGATILELGCGTGLNFEQIERVIGPEGRLIGVDMNAYTLSDREKPARFAGQKVKVTGVLREKTNVIDVESIEPLR